MPQSESRAYVRPSVERESPVAIAARAWIDLFLRTIKTCRLYRSDNPNALRFRERLLQSLQDLMTRHGSLALHLSPAGFELSDGAPVSPETSDGDLRFLLYRDGIRGLTFHPGITAEELETFLGVILARTVDGIEEDDLQIALWKAAPLHIDWLAIPLESDLTSSEEEDGELETGWPEQASEADGDLLVSGRETEGGISPLPAGRSDDWATGVDEIALAPTMESLSAATIPECESFLASYREARSATVYSRTRRIAEACFAHCSTSEDRLDFLGLLDRLLRYSLSQGDWAESVETIGMIRRHAIEGWSLEDQARRLIETAPALRVPERLDEGGPESAVEFIRFAQCVPGASVDWLVFAMSESQQRKNRRAFADAIAEHCRDRPQRLKRWISDERWYVARNIAYILGMIGRPEVVPLLEPLIDHPDRRVRREVVNTLGRLDSRAARPMLVRMLDETDTLILTMVLGRLAGTVDPTLSAMLLREIREPGFPDRPKDVREAYCKAAGSTGGEAILPELEIELQKGGWIASGRFTHCDAIALCIAGVGTPAAQAILSKGTRSLRAEIRNACKSAMEESPR